MVPLSVVQKVMSRMQEQFAAALQDISAAALTTSAPSSESVVATDREQSGQSIRATSNAENIESCFSAPFEVVRTCSGEGGVGRFEGSGG